MKRFGKVTGKPYVVLAVDKDGWMKVEGVFAPIWMPPGSMESVRFEAIAKTITLSLSAGFAI